MRLDKQDFFLLLKSAAVDNLSFSEAKEQVAVDASWIDVRTQDEFEKGHCFGAINMPLNLLKLKSRMLSRDKHYIVFCNSGRRSDAAAHLLTEDGFNVSVLRGGYYQYSAADQCYFEQVTLTQ